jgi:hypothetical protein
MMKMIAGVPKDFSLAQKTRSINAVSKNPRLLSPLVDVFLTAHYRISQRVAGVLEAVAKRDPSLLQPHLKRLLTTLEKRADTGLKRNIPRIIQWMHIPVSLQGRMVNVCFDLLADPAELVAPKVFCMTVLANIAKEQPDLKGEIRAQIESQYNLSTPAFRSRAKRVLRMLER